jgi:hypothetical protein
MAEITQAAKDAAQEWLPENWNRAIGPVTSLAQAFADFAAAAVAEREALIVEYARRKAQIFHRFAADEVDHLRTQHVALSSAYGQIADTIERGEHMETTNDQR